MGLVINNLIEITVPPLQSWQSVIKILTWERDQGYRSLKKKNIGFWINVNKSIDNVRILREKLTVSCHFFLVICTLTQKPTNTFLDLLIWLQFYACRYIFFFSKKLSVWNAVQRTDAQYWVSLLAPPETKVSTNMGFYFVQYFHVLNTKLFYNLLFHVI